MNSELHKSAIFSNLAMFLSGVSFTLTTVFFIVSSTGGHLSGNISLNDGALYGIICILPTIVFTHIGLHYQFKVRDIKMKETVKTGTGYVRKSKVRDKE